MSENERYKIIFYVPVKNAEEVKLALFSSGAGQIGNYDCCSFETLGFGQFRPKEGSHPYIGTRDKIEKVEELRVEMICAGQFLSQAIKALKQAHPYEEPAFDVIKLEEVYVD